MSYAFEDYDSFLASLNNNPNVDNKTPLDQLQGNSIVSNPSYSTSLSLTDDEENVLNSFYDFDSNSNLTPTDINDNLGAKGNPAVLLSPDYTSNSSNSPNDFNMNGGFNQEIQDFGFNNGVPFDLGQQQQLQQQLNQYGSNSTTYNNSNIRVKQESISSSVSTSSSTSPQTIIEQPAHSTKVKLANAVPRGSSISKRGPKKEKSSHNMIEKRYRTNINDKIKALRDSVPALRVLVDSGDDDDEHDDELDGLQPAKKLNKATILSKATEYIKHLEAKNESLRRENEDLKARIYGGSYSNITPGSSISSASYSSDMYQNQGNYHHNSQGGNIANKVLLGGLACMVGAGLNDDLGNYDSKSLFALPVFSYDQSGFSLLGKPLVVLMKVLFIVGVVLNFVFPTLFYSKNSKKSTVEEFKKIEDIRNLKGGSILSTFSLKTNHSVNDYVKSAIFRSLLLKVSYYNSNTIIKSVIEVYVDHLWTYLKKVKLDVDQQDYDILKSILSLPNQESIHNNEYILKFVKSDPETLSKGPNNEADYSAISIFYHMIHETTTNNTLRNFLLSSISHETSIAEISKEICQNVHDYDIELKTLFNPVDSQITKFKKRLESIEVSNLVSDELLVLHSSIIQNLVSKEDYSSAKKWFNKIDLTSIESFQLLGFTSLYMTILTLVNSKEMFTLIQGDEEFSFKIEEIAGSLRIWLGNSNGSVLNFKKRSQLIDYFVNVGLKINGLEQNDESVKA